MLTGPRKALAQIQNPPSPPANVVYQINTNLSKEETTGLHFESCLKMYHLVRSLQKYCLVVSCHVMYFQMDDYQHFLDFLHTQAGIHMTTNTLGKSSYITLIVATDISSAVALLYQISTY